MNKKFFGTDGIRGKANVYPLVPDFLMKLAVSLSQVMKIKTGKKSPKVIIGKDTRLSGYMIESALTSGLIAAGVEVVLVGPVPTAGVSMLVVSRRVDFGIMISASHNSFQDNGIKILDNNGCKLNDETELIIEDLLSKDYHELLVANEQMGRAYRFDEGQGRYIEFVKNTIDRKISLNKLKIVLDTANGAAYKVAPQIFWELGAQLITIGNKPNGLNINKNCGSLHTQLLQKTVLENKADIGIAFDGDADRLIIIDEKGNTVDGDKILAVLAVDRKKNNRLDQAMVVSTEMANSGLERYLQSHEIALVRSQVGDRYVFEQMQRSRATLGGEPSGHIILSDYINSADACVTALQFLSVMVRYNKTSSQLASCYKALPQIIRNIEYNQDPSCDQKVMECIENNKKRLYKENARLVVRKSGTQPVIRLMAEGEGDIINDSLDDIVSSMKHFIAS